MLPSTNGVARVNKRPIAVFDSGVGGLPYLEYLRKDTPKESFVYLADRENFPYGEKSDKELRSIIIQSVGKFIQLTNPKLMIIACNTASVVALSELRCHFNIPFIGVVPAVKPAAEHSKKRSIGILATRRTVKEPYTENLIHRFAADCRVVRYAGAEIVELVEHNFFTSSQDEKTKILNTAFDFFQSAGIDALVVGCTHFIFVEELLHAMLKGTTEIIDSREGVAKQTLRVMKKNGLHETSENGGRGQFFVSGKDMSEKDNERYSRFAGMFELEWSGLL